MQLRTIFVTAAGGFGFAGALGTIVLACVEPPPKIAAIPASGMSLRLFVFGASAQDARQAFESAKQTNKNLRLAREGGDGEVLVGLENDSPRCVQPTGLCSFKVAVRIRDNDGKVVHASTMTAAANAERCTDLCERALNTMVVKVIEAAAANLRTSGADGDASRSAVDPAEGGAASEPAPVDAGAPADAGAAKSATKKPASKGAVKPEPPPAPKPEPALCVVGHGQHLPSDEAEKRAAQVEALKRLEVLDQDEYDCLRKAYLDRL